MTRQSARHQPVHGFTVIEILLVIALFGLLSALAVPFYSSFQTQQRLEGKRAEIVSLIRTAQVSSMAGADSDSHGFHVEPTSVTFFTGSAYTPGHPDAFTVDLGPQMTVSTSFGDTALFQAPTGTPDRFGTLTLGLSTRSYTITINELGTVSYND
ncbi:MAG: type II secretion system protein [Patescibacteria group bacterium]|jgi:prepilin-type N-terminal cleavage/methylation domain-containing protein